MKIRPLELEGVLHIEPKVFGDTRGFFFEFWNETDFAASGFRWKFVQDNISRSSKGVLRGLHFQNPRPQGKLVTVLDGDVFDVVVDLRKSSPTFKKWLSVRLTGDTHHSVFVPPGFAHGFQVLSESALFAYKCTDLYDANTEAVLKWNDPEIGIEWPLADPILSAKDLKGQLLCDLERGHLF